MSPLLSNTCPAPHDDERLPLSVGRNADNRVRTVASLASMLFRAEIICGEFSPGELDRFVKRDGAREPSAADLTVPVMLPCAESAAGMSAARRGKNASVIVVASLVGGFVSASTFSNSARCVG